MKDPKELRIGNLVMAPPDMEAQILIPDAIGTVSAILPFGDVILNLMPTFPSWKVPCKHLAPIPITPELLTRLGFSNDVDEYWIDSQSTEYRPLKIRLIHSSDGWYCAIWDEDIETVLFEKKDFYAHQLQNLFFALTQKELELKQLVSNN